MRYDIAKVEEAVLALLGVFEFENGRVWKRFDFDIMDSLHAPGYITDPKSHRESVHLTEEWMALAKRLANEHFDLVEGPRSSGRSWRGRVPLRARNVRYGVARFEDRMAAQGRDCEFEQ